MTDQSTDHPNPFLLEKARLERQYDRAQLHENLATWTWKNGSPPRDEIIYLVGQFSALSASHHREPPSEKRRALDVLSNRSIALQKAIPRPLLADHEFLAAWIKAGGGDYLVDVGNLTKLLDSLESACTIAKEAYIRRNTARDSRRLGECLLKLFEQRAELKQPEKLTIEGPAFLEFIAEAFQITIPVSLTSYRPSRKSQISP